MNIIQSFRRKLCLVLFGAGLLWSNILSASQQIPIESIDIKAMTWQNGDILAVDLDGSILISENFGLTFDPLINVFLTENYWWNIVSANQTVIAVGEDARVARSTDGGMTWMDQSPDPSTFFFVDFKTLAAGPLVSSERSWVVAGGDGIEASFAFSANDGLSWTKGTVATGSSEGQVSGVTFDVGSQQWFAVGESFGEGISWISTDGINWIEKEIPTGVNGLNAVQSDDSGQVVAAGNNGGILLWDTAEEEWIVLGPGFYSENFFAVETIAQGQWIIGGEDILISWDDSAGFTENPSIESGVVNALLWVQNEEILFVGGEEILSVSLPPDLTTASLSISVVNGEYIITLNIPNGDAGKMFALESSQDLVNWTAVAGTTLVINDFPFSWPALTISPGDDRRFWRAVWVP